MARKRRGGKQGLNPDPKHNSRLVTNFVNCLFRQGKKSTGERIFYSALDTIKERTGNEGLEVFEKAIKAWGLTQALREDLAGVRQASARALPAASRRASVVDMLRAAQ